MNSEGQVGFYNSDENKRYDFLSSKISSYEIKVCLNVIPSIVIHSTDVMNCLQFTEKTFLLNMNKKKVKNRQCIGQYNIGV